MNKYIKKSSQLSILIASSLFLLIYCIQPLKIVTEEVPRFENNNTIVSPGRAKLNSPFFMHVSVDGKPPFTFEWFRDGRSIQNINTSLTTDTLKFDPFLKSHAGVYYCVVRNEFSTDTTDKLDQAYNSRPVFTNARPDAMFQINEGDTFTLSIRAADNDSDKITYFFSLDTLPLPRPDSILFLDDTLLMYRSFPGENRELFQVTVAATDSIDTSFVPITILVNNVNYAPVLDSINDTIVITEDSLISFTANAGDIDDDSIILTAYNLPNGAVFMDKGIDSTDTVTTTFTGTFTWKPTYNDAGMYSITIQASDGEASDNKHVIIRVLNKRYTITATAGAGGSISPWGSITLDGGVDRTFYIVPDAGYQITDVMIDSVSSGVVSSYTFSSVSKDHSIEASFTVNTYKLAISKNGNGITAPGGEITAVHGTPVQVIAVPSFGYHFSKWSYFSGTPIISDEFNDTTTITLENGNASVSASFEINTYTIATSTQRNGGIDISPQKQHYTHGDTVTISATPPAGAHFTGWSGDVFSMVNPLVLVMTSDLSLKANFSTDEYDVNISLSNRGLLNPRGIQKRKYNDIITVTATPLDHFLFVDWTVTGGITIKDGDNTGEFVITGNGTINANFVIDSNTVTFIAGNNGSINGDTKNIQIIPYGGSCKPVIAMADNNYHFTHWSNSLNATTRELFVTNVTTDMIIKANFAVDSHTVTFTSGTNGSINGNYVNVQVIPYGGDCIPVTARAGSNHHFTHWSGDLNATTYELTVKNVTTDMNITANFAIDSNTVTFIAGNNGSIKGNPIDSQIVPFGGSCKQVIPIAENNYHFTHWSGAHGFYATTRELVVTNVTADMNFTANFAIDSHTVTFTSGANGSIRGVLNQEIEYGRNCTKVTAEANKNFHFIEWEGDFSSTDSELIISNVTSDMNISAKFAIDSHTVTFISGGNGTLEGNYKQIIPHGGHCTPVIAKPNTDYHFKNWTGGYNDTAAQITVLNITSDMTITANFSSYVAKVACGENHSLILRKDSTLWAAGKNTSGQLGDGTYINKNTPVPITDNVIDIACGNNHSLILKKDNSLWATGYNEFGQLGDGSNTNKHILDSITDNVIDMVCGENHSLIRKKDNSLWTTGLNDSGQLGDGTNTNKNTLDSITNNVIDIACGAYHSLIRKMDNSLWATGANNFGQLGDGTNTTKNTLDSITDNVIDMTCGAYHSLIRKMDNSLWATGRNYNGQLGDGTSTDRNIPKLILNDVSSVIAGEGHTLIIKTDNTLWATGRNNNGQLGDAGTSKSRNKPVIISNNCSAIAAGYDHTLVIKTDNTLWGTGKNVYGQLGDGSYIDKYSPVKIDFD